MGVFYDWSIVSLLEKMTLWAWTWLSSQARFASQNSHSVHKVSMWNVNIRLPWSEVWNCTLNQNMEISLIPLCSMRIQDNLEWMLEMAYLIICHQKLHIKSKHGNITYPCAQCEYKTTWKWILNRHIESVHVNISNLFDQCEYNIRQLRNFLLILYITLTQLHLYPMWILNNSEGKFVTAYLI